MDFVSGAPILSHYFGGDFCVEAFTIDYSGIFFFNAGLRKPPQQIPSSTNYEEYIFSQWKNIIDEQARRRLQAQRQRQQQFAYAANGDDGDSDANGSLTDDMSGPGFTYKLPAQYSSFGNDDDVPFAVGPSHPKFYEKNPNTDRTMSAAAAAATLAEGGSLMKPSDANMLSYKNVLNSDADSIVHLNRCVFKHVCHASLTTNGHFPLSICNTVMAFQRTK